MSKLSFISDHDLDEAVANLLTVAGAALKESEDKFNKNVIDPFSAIFEMAGFQIDENTWRSNEKTRKAQKTLSNQVGAFHQTILSKIQGWQNPGPGGIIDLVSHNHKIIAEIKNKHNTVKGANLTHLYSELENLVMPKTSKYKDYTAYYVAIIPKKPGRYDLPFTPSDKAVGKRKSENSLIRKIDGFSFYDKVTGVENTLLQLFKALPELLQSHRNAYGYRFQNAAFLETLFETAFGKTK
ncbi:MAG: type restriction enzyme (Eco47II, Sau96I) [Gammaproteobacteria bacterium]|jgi:hypothetical protein|nr:type restriction enzyme (Eco47II, Sau96I) [Gammaproteobacteria bacterium]MCE3239336.1 type restriction enzyme (Eco47II, Sau96I) [Gammaproteobacteria bacterium]